MAMERGEPGSAMTVFVGRQADAVLAAFELVDTRLSFAYDLGEIGGRGSSTRRLALRLGVDIDVLRGA